MQPITHKVATEIARAARAHAVEVPAFYRLQTLHDQVNEALAERGYGLSTVLAMDCRSTKSIALEIYHSAKRARTAQ